MYVECLRAVLVQRPAQDGEELQESLALRQSKPRSNVRKLATFCRPLFDMKPAYE